MMRGRLAGPGTWGSAQGCLFSRTRSCVPLNCCQLNWAAWADEASTSDTVSPGRVAICPRYRIDPTHTHAPSRLEVVLGILHYRVPRREEG
jgi:hypothetical protein